MNLKAILIFLGENTEKYIIFSAPIYKKNDNDKTIIYKLKFIDSFRFMSASLSNLVDNLSGINKKESINELIEKFPNTYWCCNRDLNKFALLLRKGVYPYEYMNSWEKFNETSLPDKEAFYSNLNKEKKLLMNTMHLQKKFGKYLE